MAQIDTGGGDGKKKGHQKKMQIHVDFTPMVDMNMLLITFFMLCTTMIKSQTLQIALPSNKKVDNVENQSQASAADAVTIIVDAKRVAGSEEVDSVNGTVVDVVYFYKGKPAELTADGNAIAAGMENPMRLSSFLTEKDNSTSENIRAIMQEKNKQAIEAIDKLKEQWRKKEINDSIYEARAAEFRQKKGDGWEPPVFIIKAAPEASYGNLVRALDEISINQIGYYQIDNLNHADSIMLRDFRAKHPNGK